MFHCNVNLSTRTDIFICKYFMFVHAFVFNIAPTAQLRSHCLQAHQIDWSSWVI